MSSTYSIKFDSNYGNCDADIFYLGSIIHEVTTKNINEYLIKLYKYQPYVRRLLYITYNSLNEVGTRSAILGCKPPNNFYESLDEIYDGDCTDVLYDTTYDEDKRKTLVAVINSSELFSEMKKKEAIEYIEKLHKYQPLLDVLGTLYCYETHQDIFDEHKNLDVSHFERLIVVEKNAGRLTINKISQL